MAYSGSKYIEDDYLSIAMGHAKNVSHIHKFGANFDIDTGSDPESIWTGGGLYPWDAFDTAGVLVLTSTSTEDDEDKGGGVEGTGAHRVFVEGLDENYNLVTETFITNGTSTRTGTQTFKRVFRAFVTAGNTNIGTITFTRGGTNVMQIDAGRGQTLMAIYTIPKNYTGFMLNLDLTVNAFRDAQLSVKQRPFNGVFRIAHMAEARGLYSYNFKIPLKFEQKTDIDFRIDEVSLSNSRATANFDLILVKK